MKEYLKGHLVLDCDLWRVMNILHEKIIITLHWRKVDSQIETKIYTEGQKPNGDYLSIRLNKAVDLWASEVGDGPENTNETTYGSHIWYEESQLMVRLSDSRLIYGNISQQVSFDISQVGMSTYLMGKNPHWNKEIFNMLDWKEMGAFLGKMPETMVTNTLKLVHGWQNDSHQKDLFYENNADNMCPA